MRRHALAIIEAHSLVIAKHFTDLLFLFVGTRIVDSLDLVIVVIVRGKGHAPVGRVSDLGSCRVKTSSALVVDLQLLSVDSAHFRIA